MGVLRTTVLACAIAAPAGGLLLVAAASIPYGPSNFLREYQDLIAGLLALTGALTGAAYINRQINQSRDQERFRLSRRHAAARAVMPLALDGLTTYAAEIASVLVEARTKELQVAHAEEAGYVSFVRDAIRDPLIAETLIRDFAAMIEAAEPADGDVFFDLLSDLQVQRARLKGLTTEPSGLTVRSKEMNILQLEHRLLEAVYIHAAAGALFAYARLAADRPAQPTWDDVHLSMVTLNLFENGQTGLYDLCQRTAAVGPPSEILGRVQRRR